MPPMPCETFVPSCLRAIASSHSLPPLALSSRSFVVLFCERPRSFFLFLRFVPPFRPSVQRVLSFAFSFPGAVSEESRPLVFLLFPSDLRLLLVITTNLSRINSPSGINSSTVQAEKEKVIARGRRAGTGNPTHPVSSSPRALTFSRASGIRVATLSPSSKMKGTEESRADRKPRNCMKLERNATSRSQLKEIRSKS